ncbi:MAG: EAL domain-containing protein [Synergistaceae bacterium]|nr:EAL domain-containing protein [Synergistaceae bacterium]
MFGKSELNIKKFFLLLAVLITGSILLCGPFSAEASYSANDLIKIGYITKTVTADKETDSCLSGYSYDYLQEIAQYYNWKLEFIPGTEEECIEWLKEGRIDLINHLHYSKDLDKELDFSNKESGICKVALYTLKNNENLRETDITSLHKKRIGRFASDKHADMLENSGRETGVEFTVVDYKTTGQLIDALNNGAVDGALISGNDIPSNFNIISVFPGDPSYFAVAEGNKELLSKIERAMHEIILLNPSFNNELFKKHYSDSLASKSAFTQEEKKYIESAGTLIASYDPSWPPFEYRDKKSGTMAGINYEIIKLVAEHTGLKIKIKNSSTWGEALRSMREGEIDILTGVNRNFIWAAKNNFMMTYPFLKAPVVMITKGGQGINLDKVALPENYYLSEEIKSILRLDNIIYFESPRECMDALKQNKVSVTFANSYVANYLISSQKHESLNLINFGDLNESLGIAISKKNDPLLLSIINKGLLSIPEDKINSIIIKNALSSEERSLVELFYEYYSEITKGLILILVLIVAALTMISIAKSKDKKKLKKLLYYDTLTGYRNFNSFVEEVPKIIEKNPDSNFAVVFIDIVGFKFINSSFGYEEGDKLLIVLSQQLDLLTDKPEEQFARVDSDHFVLFLRYGKFNSVDARLRILFSCLEKLSVKGGGYHPIFNGGVYLIEHHDIPIKIAVDNACFAKKTIKQKYKTAYEYYDPKTLDIINRERAIEASMRAALRNGEFIPYLQPKIDCHTGKPVGAEALVRWIKPDGEVILPEMFIPYFEKSGFVTKLDMYMFSETCRILRKWTNEGKKLFPLSCNFSYLDIIDTNFNKNLKTISKKHRIPPCLLELELTESVAAEHMDVVNVRGKELSGYGFKLSIDDFGSGYSSLSLLQTLKIDVLKLDRVFVQKGIEGKLSHDLVEGLVNAFKANSIQIVFEGTETKEQVDFVKSLGCRIVQGYYYSKPLSLSEFEKRYFN